MPISSRARSRRSQSGLPLATTPSTAHRTIVGAQRLAKIFALIPSRTPIRSIQATAPGTRSSAVRACCRVAARSGPRSALTCSARSRPPASARWVPSGTSRMVLAATATATVSHVWSSPSRPTTDGIIGASCWRLASLVPSLTSRASSASSGWVQEGWSLHRSPASTEASSMKHAPRRGVRWRPRDRTGIPSGRVEGFMTTSSLEDAPPRCSESTPGRAIRTCTCTRDRGGT